MSQASAPRALLVAGDGASGGDEIKADLLAAGWKVDLREPEGHCQLAVVCGSQPLLQERLASLRGRLPHARVVAVGEARVDGASCWFQGRPPHEVWTALLRELCPPSSPVRSPEARWRRKGDMIIGHSAATQELLRVLDRLAPSSAAVLVTGESGTGKELVARALHFSGPRAKGPFIALNCAALPESLVEAELFGHQKGAFTGAAAARAGAFEAADGGTLFLDEIGEMPLLHQAKLLRVLETAEVTRLGSNSPKRVNVRLVAATNRDLREEVSEGRFREDLYYRLQVYPVHLKPLRERLEDLPPIVHHHLSLIATRENRPQRRLEPAALDRLLSHAWPGNVRELLNTLERACLVADGPVIHASDLHFPGAPASAAVRSLDNGQDAGPPGTYRDARRAFETRYYAEVLQLAGGNISQVAKLADKTRKEVYDALRRLGLDAMQFRSSPRRSASGR